MRDPLHSLFLTKNTRTRLPLFLFALMVCSIFFFSPAFADDEKEIQIQVYLTNKQALEIAFPGADEVEKEKHWLTDDQRKAIGDLSFQTITEQRMTFYVGKKKGKSLGYMVIDNVIGKSFPITYMVVLNADGTVRDVEVMVYREPRGWEVRDKSFLSQFFGKDSASDLRGINTLTGATLSVRAMTHGVQKAAASYKVLYLDK